MVSVCSSMLTNEYTKGNGKPRREKGKASSNIQTATSTSECTTATKRRARAFILGITERSTTENGSKASSTVSESGRDYKANRM